MSIATGFFNRAAKFKEKEEDRFTRLLDASFTENLKEVKQQRKEDKVRERELLAIGGDLATLGLDRDSIAAVIGTDVARATATTELLKQKAMQLGKGFNPNDIVKASGGAGITIEEAVKRMIGEFDTTEKAEDGIQVNDSLFGASRKFQDKTRAALSSASGQDYGSVLQEAQGTRVRGELPTAIIDYGAMQDPKTKLEVEAAELRLDEQRRQEAINSDPAVMASMKLQASLVGEQSQQSLNKIKKEIEVLDKELGAKKVNKGLSASENQSLMKSLSSQLANKLQLDVAWTPEGGWVTKTDDYKKAAQFATQSAQALALFNLYYQEELASEKDKGSAYAAASIRLQSSALLKPKEERKKLSTGRDGKEAGGGDKATLKSSVEEWMSGNQESLNQLSPGDRLSKLEEIREQILGKFPGTTLAEMNELLGIKDS